MRKNGLKAQKLINYFKHLPLSLLSLLVYRLPSRKLKVIGVTGTDGKTTTVHLLYHILQEAGRPVAMISTVCAKIKEEEIDTGFHVTSPNPWLLQKLIKAMVKQKIEYLVLEVTSHGLDQFRDWGINYEIGILTNITHEHLDYHQTYENYLKTKVKLLKKSKIAVINRDDTSYQAVSRLLNQSKKNHFPRIVTYGIKNKSDFMPENFKFKTNLPGEYNQYNCLAAIAASISLGIPPQTVKAAISSFAGVTGRMEEIREGQDFRVIVDFAHTPNALEQVLRTLREQLEKGRKLIVVFGAAGRRDRAKRPLMGKVAGQLADFVIITAEDPRTEEVTDICQQIALGCEEVGGKYEIISEREKAIERAIVDLAKTGDIVVICGKGHERSMCFGKTEYPWSDQEAVRKALRRVLQVSPASPASKATKEVS